MVRRSLVSGCVALLRPHGLVERRVARPRAEDAKIEVEPVHDRSDESMVDLLLDRPPVRAGRRQTRLKGLQGHAAGGDGRRAVVGCAVLERRPLEGGELREEFQQTVIRPGGLPGVHGDGQDRRREPQRAHCPGEYPVHARNLTTLFTAQHDHRIDAGRVARRDIRDDVKEVGVRTLRRRCACPAVRPRWPGRSRMASRGERRRAR